jgi:hypothetical protein
MNRLWLRCLSAADRQRSSVALAAGRLLSALLAMAVLVEAGVAEAATYSFTNIADTNTVAPNGGTFTRFTDPVISGNTAAFVGSYGTSHGIFTGSGGALTTIIKQGDSGPFGPFRSASAPSIGDGAVAFRAGFGDVLQSSGIFVGSGGPLTAIALSGDPGPSGTFRAFENPSISGNGVAFLAAYGKVSSNLSGIFLGNGGSLTTIVTNGDLSDTGPVYLYSLTDPILHGGSVAFLGLDQDTFRAIYTATGGSIAMAADTGGPAPVGHFAFVGDPTISDGGVAFIGADDAGSGIFKSNGGSITAIVRAGEPAPSGSYDAFWQSAIGGDTIAFLATYGGSDEQGIFLDDGGLLTTLIKTGDPLFGSTLDHFSIFGGTPQFAFDANGSGSVAFLYSLSDGRGGVALARPVAEPSTFGLAGLCAAFTLMSARFRRAGLLRGWHRLLAGCALISR